MAITEFRTHPESESPQSQAPSTQKERLLEEELQYAESPQETQREVAQLFEGLELPFSNSSKSESNM